MRPRNIFPRREWILRSPRESLEGALRSGAYVDITDWPQVRVDLRYGSKNNLLREDVYEGFQRALLHPVAAEKFRQACEILKTECPQFRFLVFDSLRPQSAQVKFWNLVVNTRMQSYFADPQKGSLHSYGFAIDLGLLGSDGKEVDMGTGFDSLEVLAEPQRELEMKANGRLSETQLQNRLCLRSVMQSAGFIQLPHEWWHYDALTSAQVRAEYSILE